MDEFARKLEQMTNEEIISVLAWLKDRQRMQVQESEHPAEDR